MAKKKKETMRQVLSSAKRESFRDWTIIQKGLLLIFVVGVSLAIVDMSCGKKTEQPRNVAPTQPPPKLVKE